MTYSVGQTALAADFVGFRGANDVNAAYASNVDATGKLAALIGMGYGSRGYGQISTVLGNVAVGDTITAAQWNQLFAVMTTINTHTGSALTIPTPLSIGSVIQALDGSSGRANIASLLSVLDTNRLNASVGQMGLTSSLVSTRSTSWNTSVDHEFTVTFTTENDARYFFNSGGRIYISGSRTGGSATVLNSSITTMLSDMGTIRLGATTATYTGTGGTISSALGYYNLTTSYQTVITAVSTIGYGYSAPTYTLECRVESVAGINGANGRILRFRATIDTNAGPTDTVNGTLTSSVSQYKANGVLTIASPAFATTNAL